MGYRLQHETTMSHFSQQEVYTLYLYFITLFDCLGSGKEVPYFWCLPPTQGLHVE